MDNRTALIVVLIVVIVGVAAYFLTRPSTTMEPAPGAVQDLNQQLDQGTTPPPGMGSPTPTTMPESYPTYPPAESSPTTTTSPSTTSPSTIY